MKVPLCSTGHHSLRDRCPKSDDRVGGEEKDEDKEEEKEEGSCWKKVSGLYRLSLGVGFIQFLVILIVLHCFKKNHSFKEKNKAK